MATQGKTEVQRIPLVGTFNTRVIVPPAGTDSGYVGIGVVGKMVVGAGVIPLKDQRFVNAIPDKITNTFTQGTKYYVYKRPGLETHTTPQAGSAGYAVMVWTGQTSGNKVVSAFGSASTIYVDSTPIGSLNGTAFDITETIVGSTATVVIPTENNLMYFYSDGGTLTQITDGDFPSNAGFTITGAPVHQNGYTYIMTTDGKIWNSDLNSISSWSASNFISANSYPDQGTGLQRYKDLIVAFGRETVEFFKDVGNAIGSPLQKVTEGIVRIGCISPYSMTAIEDNIAWVASSSSGSTSVYMFNGYTPQRISTNAIDSQLSVRGGVRIKLSSVKIFGKTLIFVVFGSRTYVYCVEDQMWHEWAPVNGGNVLWHRWAASSAATSVVYAISSDSNGGKVYRVNPISTVYQDDGSNYVMTIQTSKFDLDTERRKYLRRLTLVADTTTSASTMNVQWSDDDYITFNTARTIDMTSNNKYLSNCGSFRRRAFKLTETSSVSQRLEALEFDVDSWIH